VLITAALGLLDDHDHLAAVAGYILARKVDKITNRHVQRGDRTMRSLAKKDVERVFEQLDALGWVTRTPAKRTSDPPHWIVNPVVHELFKERAQSEEKRRSDAKEAIARALKKA
jgi:ribosomal protein S19E (S16A)